MYGAITWRSNILRHLSIYLTHGDILLFIIITVLNLVCIYQNLHRTKQSWHRKTCPSFYGGRSSVCANGRSSVCAKELIYHLPPGNPIRSRRDLPQSFWLCQNRHWDATRIYTPRTNASEIDSTRFCDFVQGPMNTSGTIIRLFTLGTYFTALPIVSKKSF